METLAVQIGSTPNKVRLAVVGLISILLGWFVYFAYMSAGLPIKDALVQAVGLFWPGTTLLAPALYDMACRAWGRKL